MPRIPPSAPKWQPGTSGNPLGRPVGSRNKLNEKFIAALYQDFLEHGTKVIEEVREKRPEIYLKVIASILPREMHFKAETSFAGITDEQLDEVIAATRSILTARAGASSPSREAPSSSSNEPDQLH